MRGGSIGRFSISINGFTVTVFASSKPVLPAGGAVDVFEMNLTTIIVALTGEHFKIDNPGGFAVTLPPGGSTTVKVKFEPKSFGEKKGRIRISSNAVNENPISVAVKGKQYAVITFIVEEEVGAAKIENVKLKIKQSGQDEQEVTTGAGGKVEFETEKDGKFEVKLGDYETVLEFRSLTFRCASPARRDRSQAAPSSR